MKKFLIFSLLTFLPLRAGALLKNTSELSEQVYNILTEWLIPIVFTLALLFFFWGIAKYIWSVGAEKEQGKQIMVWGVIALFVMSSIWALVFFISGELGVDSFDPGSGGIGIPKIQK